VFPSTADHIKRENHENTVTLIAAPTAPQPGGYVQKAYADRTLPNIKQADLNVEPAGKG